MKKFALLYALLGALSASAIAADKGVVSGGVGKDMPMVTPAVGSACQDEGTLDNMLAANPLVCTNRKWRKAVFKDAAGGVKEPLFYGGKCSLRFAEEATTEGKIVLKAGGIADICLPVGWRVHLAASSNNAQWKYENPQSMPNVILVRVDGVSAKSTLWIYPKNHEGRVQEKLRVDLISTAKAVKSVDSPVVPIQSPLCVGPKGAYCAHAQHILGRAVFIVDGDEV